MTKQKPMIIYEHTVPGVFIRRINRFTAEVLVDDRKEIVHVKNTGRLKELLTPEARITLQKASDSKRKTAYDLISVYKEKLKWVNIDSLAPNMLMKQQLLLQDYDLVKPEYTYGESRIDFYMEKNGEKYLTEVKDCTLAADTEQGIGLFPDAPTVRGVKHLHELAKAAQEGYHCSVAFVIQMNGIHLVFPNDETQPEFRQALINVVETGVKVMCYGCQVEADRIMISEVTEDTERYIKHR